MLSKLSSIPSLRVLGTAAVLALLPATAAFAQVTPAASHTPPDDTPTSRSAPRSSRATPTRTRRPRRTPMGTSSTPAASRCSAYINVTGNLSHLICGA